MSFPAAIVAYFEAGGFTVNITEQKWHSVALDEAHEMCINKDLKGAVIRSTDAYLQKTSLFFNYRINLLKHFKAQLYPEENSFCYEPTIMTTDPAIIKMFRNVTNMAKSITDAQLLPIQTSTNRGLINAFTNSLATPEQAHDMLAFRIIGEEALDHYITHVIIGEPSTTNVVRHRKLLTMTSPKATKRKQSQKEKENKVVMTCLRRRLAWCNRTGLKYDVSKEQYSPYPRALSDEKGIAHKASKSMWTEKLKSRYSSCQTEVFHNKLPPGWIYEVCIIDAMFLINTKPLRNTRTVEEYAKFLFNRFVLEHYKAGASEVQLIFDKPGKQCFNPKQFEQSCRDTSKQSSKHVCIPVTPIPIY